MGEPMDVVDFKSQFYNLHGIHINERKKNFNKLLKSTKTNIPDEQIDIQPRNYLENIFYVDVLIHFKKVDKLIEILRRGTGVLSSKILKQQWFFQEAFKNMKEEDIVNKFLPTLSHSLRMKVLRKLSLVLNEERMDTIFDLLLERYGLYIAKQFLFSCSPGKIAHVLKNHEIILLPELLNRIAEKDVKLLKIYIQEYKTNMNRDFKNYDFLNCLVWRHPNLYFDLGLDSENGIKLGRYTTRAVIKNNKEGVLKDIKNSSFNKGALVREVKEFDKEYLSLFFPNDIKDIVHHASNLASLVSKYPIKKRWEVFSQAFKKSYNKEVEEHLNLFEENLSTFFPENIQEKWAEIKYLDGNNVRYIKYYDPKKAVKLLKDKINVTSDIQTRGLFLNELITVCYKHKDYSTYEEVLKYISTRHRNDGRNVRSNLIDHIDKNIDYDLITDAHWKYINEIIDIQRLRDEHLSLAVMSKYLVFAFKNKLPLDGPVTQYAKDCIKSGDPLRFPSGLKEIVAESIVLKCIVKILPSIEHDNRKDTTRSLMYSIVEFNKEVKSDKIFKKELRMFWIDLNECPVILDLIKEVLTKQQPYNYDDQRVVSNLMEYNYLYSDVPVKGIDQDALLNIVKSMIRDEFNSYMVNDCVIEIIKKSKRNCFEEKLHDCFCTEIIKCDTASLVFKMDGLKHFLIREPEVIAKYFSVILSLDSNCDLPLLDYNIIKKYSHLGLEEKVVSHFKELLSVDSKCERKKKLLNALSKVMNTTEFLDVVKDYIPDSKKLDLENEEQKKIYQVQCDIANAFRNLDKASYHILAPVLMHFCQGDYLQSSLPALYKVMYGINEETALSYINELGSLRAMSAKKHAVFFSFETLPIKDAMAFYARASNKESNISAKKYLFNSLLKYFIRNPLRSLIDIVALNMDFIDKDDSEMIKLLVESVSKVPNEYKPLFIEKVWGFLDSLERQEVDVIVQRNKILYTINENEMILVSKINKNFCEDVIKKYFLASDDGLLKYSYEIDRFVVRFLLAYTDDSHFEFIFNIIKLYREIHWKSKNKDTLSYIFRFFMHAYKKFDNNNVQFLKLFTKFWQQTFSHIESFSQYTLLKLMILYKENRNTEAFCKEVDMYFQEIMAEYGSYIDELIFRSIEKFYSNISTEDNTNFDLGNFAFFLLQSNLSEFNCSVAFKIIKDFTNTEQIKIYSKVVEALESGTHLTARVYSNILLKGSSI